MHGVAIPNNKVATNKFLAKVRLNHFVKIFKPTFKKKMNSKGKLVVIMTDIGDEVASGRIGVGGVWYDLLISREN